jgi:DNA-binding NtrC family response regulator
MSLSPSTASRFAVVPPSTLSTGAELVGASPAMERLRLQVRRIGPHFRSVLVSGEAGTGKEFVALALHRLSHGASEFVVCRGEDSPADGVVAASADPPRWISKIGGRRRTLFLDEVGEMDLQAQDRLLVALRRHEYVPDGSGGSQRSAQRGDPGLNLRMIASTRKDLRVLVSAGRFRQELYQRFAAVQIAVPSLRDRIEDLPELAEYFVKRFALLYGRDVREIAEEAIGRLRQYRWPGNVRELEHVLRSSVLASEGEVLELRHLPALAEKGDVRSTIDAGRSMRLQDVVEQHVLRILKECGGNKLRAASMLGISRSTLYRMLDDGASSGHDA